MREERKVSQFERTLAPYIRKLVIIAMIIVAGFAVYHIMAGQVTRAAIEAVIMVAFVVAWMIAREPGHMKYVLHMVMFTGLAGLLLSMIREVEVVVWLSTLIVAAFAWFEKKQAAYWVMAVNVGVLLLMLFDSTRDTPMYSTYFAVHIVLSCFWLSVISFFAYRKVKAQHQWTLEEEIGRERKAVAQTLAGGMAHVMNNEILAIVGKLECLQYRLHRKEDAEALEEVIELAMKVSEHGNRLALYAQPDQKQRQRIDLYDTCRAVVKQFKKSLPQEIEIQLSEADVMVQCLADEVQIAQALAQIIENARDAIVERWQQQGRVNHGRIGISFQKRYMEQDDGHLQPGQYVRITVADDGWGVADEMRDKLFQPFSTSRQAGRGMGLAVAQSIVRQHGGEMSFESDVGKGSLFHIDLPVAETKG